mgnify:CR=1 FL=1
MLQGQLFQKKTGRFIPWYSVWWWTSSLKFYKDAKSSAMRQSDPGYGDQHRIVPSDQVDDAKAELAKKAQENRAKGRENAATQQEKTRDLIDDRIHGKDGTESTPMTKKQNDDLTSKTNKEG